MSLCAASLNTSGINRSNEYLTPATQTTSEAMRQLLTEAFTRPLSSFDLDSLFESLVQRRPDSWLRFVESPSKFFIFAQAYVAAAGKNDNAGDVAHGEELAMRDLIEAFAEGDVSFSQMMGTKGSEPLSDGRILSIADRIANRFTVLYDPSARSAEDPRQWIQRWLESVDKTDQGLLDNVHKFLVPNAQGNALVELGHGCSEEMRAMALTVMFYSLFIADFATSSYTGDMPAFDSEAEHRQKLDALRDILRQKRPDVLFIQEPIDDLHLALQPASTHNASCFGRLLGFDNGASASYQLHHSFSHQTAIVVSTAAFAAYELTEVDCSAHVEASSPLINGCTAVIARSEVGEPCLLLSVHIRSASKPGTTSGALTKLLQDICAEHNVPRALVGIDANADLLHNTPGAPTSVKQRSFLQYQLAKALKEEHARKDFIIEFRHADGSLRVRQADDVQTQVRATDGSLQFVTADRNTQVFLPTAQHPFDHYLVSSSVDLQEA